MIDIMETIEVARPADEVFAYLSDFANNPRWQDGMVSAAFTTEPPLRVGSEYDQEARFMGKKIISHFRITELTPGRSVTIETTESTFPIKVTRSVTPLDEQRCEVTAHVTGDASGVFALAAPMMRWMVGRSVRADYARLKAVLEA